MPQVPEFVTSHDKERNWEPLQRNGGVPFMAEDSIFIV
jgi:hypothetical protein